MEPLNPAKVISLQDPLPPALDLSVNYKKNHKSSRSAEALVKKSTWCDRGTVDQSPMGFSGVRAEHCISQPCPEVATQDDSELALRAPFGAVHPSGSKSRLNGHLPASHFPSDVYNCKADLPKKTKVRSPGQEAEHHIRSPTRVDLRNGFVSHFPVPKAAGENTVGPFGHKNHTNSTPWVSKSVSPSKGYETFVESSIGTPPEMPLHVLIQGITSQGHKVNPVITKLVAKNFTEIKHSSSPVCIDSDDSDVIEVPVSNFNKNVQSSQIFASPPSSAGAQTLDGHTNSTVFSEKCGSDGVYICASEYSTSGAFAAQPPNPTSSKDPSNEGVGDPLGGTEANAQSPPKQQKTGSLPGQAKASPGKAKRKKKKQRQVQASSSSMFSPQEPEIRLKYANQKEEKRDSRTDSSFCPYVRVEHREFAACTVVNCQEEEETIQKKGRQRSALPLKPTTQASGVVPSASCLRLGRLNADSRGKPTQTCCLCGWPANSMCLGDLHGPYYPSECNQSSKQALSNLQGQRDPREVESNQGYLENAPWNPSKRPRRDWTTDTGAHASAVLVADQNSGERWVHEDCSIWSAGVYLIKGRLYGLEEAIRLANETVSRNCESVNQTPVWLWCPVKCY